MVIVSIITGLCTGGVVITLLIFLLRNKVGTKEAELCRAGIKDLMIANRDVANGNHEHCKSELRRIRKALACIIAKQYGKESSIAELATDNTDLAVDALVEQLNGD